MRNVFLGVAGFLTCPCHIPIYLALFGGAAFGGALAAYEGWILAGMGIVFIASIVALVGGGVSVPGLIRTCDVPKNNSRIAQDAAVVQERGSRCHTQPPLDDLSHGREYHDAR